MIKMYDYVFCGFGLSAIIVYKTLGNAGIFEGKTVLIIDDNAPQDKTWCFWDNTNEWHSAVLKSWDRGLFIDKNDTVDCLDGQYQYRMLDSELLYRDMLLEIKNLPNIVQRNEKVRTVEQQRTKALIHTATGAYEGKHVFNSIYGLNPAPESKKFPLLKQHFVGWYIKTSMHPFAVDTAILMDFSVSQNNATRFFYVLPVSATELLVEYTLFSPDLLELNEYEAALKDYLHKSGIASYELIKTEKGVIPMTAYPFWKQNSKSLLHIGSAGGWTKSSTGYTFNKARRQAKLLANFLRNDAVDFRNFYKTNRYYWYDRIFIEVLHGQNQLGYRLFSSLFTKSRGPKVLKFLDESATLAEDLAIVMACPKRPFLSALFSILRKH